MVKINLHENNHEFFGRKALEKISVNGVKKKLVGIEMREKAIGREGCKIFSDNKDIGYISDAKPSKIFISLHVDLFKSSVIIFLGELLNSVLKESPGSNKKLFDYLENAIMWFDQSTKEVNFHLKILVDLTKFIGFSPNIIEESHKFFDLNLGISVENKPIGNYIKDPELKKFKELLGTTFEDLNSMKIDNLLREKMLGLMIDYYSLHLQMFKSPKSINIFNEVFK